MNRSSVAGVVGERRDAISFYKPFVGKYGEMPQKDVMAACDEIGKGGPAGYDAMDRLVRSNFWLVVKNADAYSNWGVPYTDLIQSGLMGLMTGIEKYRPGLKNPRTGKPYKLSTYVSHWIRQAVQRSFESESVSYPFRVSRGVFERQAKTVPHRIRLANELFREPTLGEVSETSGISEINIKSDEAALRHSVMLDASAFRGVDTSLACPPKTGTYQADLFQHRCDEFFMDITSGLDEREREILRMRYGLAPYVEKMTLEEVGKAHKICRERARQIEKEAVEKIKCRNRLLMSLRLDDTG